MDRLPDRENTNFPLAITNALKAVADHAFLLRHQVMPVEFFTRYPKARGLLFCHETGLGKSISAASIAESFISQGRRIVVIVSKSLQNNFKDNLVKYLLGTTKMTRAEIDQAIDRNYAFVSANASNMLAQLKNASLPIDMQEILDTDPDAETVAPTNKKTRDVYLETINLEGALVICDEAHHLFNGIVSASQNARGLYDVIMRTKDVKLLFLTSNVITNTPFELVPCFNMIAGYEILPTIYNDFMDTFVARPKKKSVGSAKESKSIKQAAVMKNADHFKARIYGMVSYFGSWFESGGLLNIHSSVVRAGLPTRLPIKEVLVPMSESQYGAYAMAREKETRLKSFSTTKVVAMTKPSSSSGDSTYRIRSRLLSNYWQKTAEESAPPESQNSEKSSLVEESREYVRPAKILEKLDPATLRALDIHSPKFAAILANIKKHAGQAGLVYSAFVKTHGLDWFAAALDSSGYSKYIIGDFEHKPRYAYITGDMTAEERSAVLFAFNGPENRAGEIISLLLGSPAMSEGVDTKRIRHVHIMEAPWHFSALEQIIARAVRFGSHDDLPAADRTVQPYIYLADYPAGTKRNDEPTTDVAMYYKALRKKLLNDQFFRAMIEASIDCSVHIKDKETSAAARKHIKCMMCAPTNKPMFKQDIIDDIATPCACVQTKEQDVVVNEITYRGKTFYYKKEPSGALHLFEYNEPTSSFVRLSPMSSWYGALFKKLA
jgi:superfamily II DNA or RNA helicase